MAVGRGTPPVTLGTWLSHYLPAWMAVFLVVLPVLVSNSIRSKEVPEGVPSKWPADVNLGLLSFWMWALATSWHENRSVRSSGRKPLRSAQQRREESATILFFLCLTMVFYVVCNMNIPTWLGVSIMTASLAFPAVVLRSPSP